MQNITVAGIEETAKSREKSTQAQGANKGFNEKNYLNVRLGKGEEKRELRIRLLPIDKDSETPFKIIHMHTVKVPTEISASGWKSYVCLSKTDDIDHEKLGRKCPFCELRNEAFNRSNAATDEVEKKKWKEIGKEYFAQDVCVLRCIERGHEEDGPKFWKFTIRKDGKDPYNMINELVKARRQEKIDDGATPEEAGNILDLYEGKDLKLVITEVKQEGKSDTKTSISVMDYGREKPLSDNEEEMERWINDEKKWSDVFVAKPYEYLSIVLDGNVPFFDKSLNQWVVKDGNNNSQTPEQAAEEAAINEKIEMTKPQEEAPEAVDESSDLPF